MKKIKLGILLGIAAGIIDVLPMLAQGLSWDANLSAFTLWLIAGFFISTTTIKLSGAVKGITISFLLLLPSAFIIGWQEPISLIPVTVMTLILGSSLGFLIDKYGQ